MYSVRCYMQCDIRMILKETEDYFVRLCAVISLLLSILFSVGLPGIFLIHKCCHLYCHMQMFLVALLSSIVVW